MSRYGLGRPPRAQACHQSPCSCKLFNSWPGGPIRELGLFCKAEQKTPEATLGHRSKTTQALVALKKKKHKGGVESRPPGIGPGALPTGVPQLLLTRGSGRNNSPYYSLPIFCTVKARMEVIPLRI